ncbi:uncharacterized protein BDR25DRAFT_112762 [Lindgomyces ingoldianus]|uniref:Uncharacterized protein n=1 Tax=Lindgomyces ingoldianus TaxID=673940 RepID=A0ACB6R808_9PLEO|nr:uncharacterized protein BDR25DRAFT_112762 [Lindgomyces ingoldianus]KAF2474880.1 hypothetical protein BDR25DRAFT_112762 [Lindgomyces ingoldianus]
MRSTCSTVAGIPSRCARAGHSPCRLMLIYYILLCDTHAVTPSVCCNFRQGLLVLAAIVRVLQVQIYAWQLSWLATIFAVIVMSRHADPREEEPSFELLWPLLHHR